MKKKTLCIFLILSIITTVFCVTPAVASTPGKTHPMVATSVEFTAILNSKGEVWTWGYGHHGQLGIGSLPEYSNIPTMVNITGVKEIATGGQVGFALKENGELWGWGYGSTGMLGIEGVDYVKSPVKIDIDGVVKIAPGMYHTLVLKENGEVWSCGSNYSGALGLGVAENDFVYKFTKINIEDVVDISTADNHSFAIKKNGEIWAWGNNMFGQIGDGTKTNRFRPIRLNISGVKQISAGSSHSAALKENGEVWVWGNNNFGQFTNGTTNESLTPIKTNITGVKKIIAGTNTNACLKENGEVWMCGSNYYGQLGIGSAAKNSTIPVKVTLPKIKDISTKSAVVIATDEENNLWEWGGGYRTMVGGTSSRYDSPVNIGINIGEYDEFAKDAEVTMMRGGRKIDLTKERTVFFKSSEETAEITVVPDWKGKTPGKILLSQSAQDCVIENSGVFTIKPGQIFSPGKKIYAIWIDSGGKTVGTVYLQLIISTGNGEISLPSGDISLMEPFGFNVPEGVPLIEKQSFNISLGSLGTNVDIEGNDFKIAVGAEVGKWENEDGHWEKQKWENFKAGLASAQKDLADYTKAYEYLKKYAPKNTSVMLEDKSTVLGTFSGYIEGYVDEQGRYKITEGGIVGTAEIKYTYMGMTMVGLVPVYYEIGTGGSATLSLGAAGYVPDSGIKSVFTGYFSVKPFFELGGGIGIPNALTLGGKGNVSLDIKIAIDHDYKKVEASGSATLELKALFDVVAYSKEFAGGSFVIYETGNDDALIGDTVNTFSLNDIYNIDLDAPIMTEKRESMSTVWHGGNDSISLLSAENSSANISLIESNCYRDAAPIVSDVGTSRIMTWIADNKNRDDANKAMLVYSVYNSENDTWSTPAPLYDNGFPDYNHKMKNGYIVWQKSKRLLTADDTYNTMSATSEIYAAKWNGTGFDTPQRITQNSRLDTMPNIAVLGDKAAVCWVQNSASNLYGTSGTNSIMMSETENGAFTTPIALATSNTAVTTVSGGYDGGVYKAYYTVDMDNNLATTDDREIFYATENEIVRLTNNSAFDSNPIYENGYLFWYCDGKIYYSKGGNNYTIFDENKNGLYDNFNVYSNAYGNMLLTWVWKTESGSELRGAVFDGSRWNNDNKIFDIDASIKYQSVILEDSGKIFTAFIKEKTASDSGTDLNTAHITPTTYDLQISDAYFTDEGLVTVIKNNGLKNISRTNVSYTVGSTVQNYSYESINAGDTFECILPSTYYSNASSAQNIIISVNPDGVYDANGSDNTLSMVYNGEGLCVYNVRYHYTDGGEKITASVKNNSLSSFPTLKVSLRENSSDGAVLAEKYIYSLGAVSAQEVEFDFDSSKLSFDDNEKTVYVETEGVADYVAVSDMRSMPKYESFILASSCFGGVLTVNTVVQSNVDEDKKGLCIAAVYNSKNQLVALQSAELDFLTRKENFKDWNIDISRLAPGEYKIHYLIWNGYNSLQPMSRISEAIITLK